MNSTNGKNKISMTRLRATGAVLSLVEAVTAALFIYLLNGTGMIPWKYIMAAFAVMAVMVLPEQKDQDSRDRLKRLDDHRSADWKQLFVPDNASAQRRREFL